MKPFQFPQNSNDHINRYNTVHFPLIMIINQKAWKKSSNKDITLKDKKEEIKHKHK